MEDIIGRKYYEISKLLGYDKKLILAYCQKMMIDSLTFYQELRDYYQKYLQIPLWELTNQELTCLFSKDRCRFIDNYRLLIKDMILSNPFYEKIFFRVGPISSLVSEYLFNYFQKLNFSKAAITEQCLVWNLDYDKTCTIVARYALNQRKWPLDKMQATFSSLIDKTYDSIESLLGEILYLKSQEEINSKLDHTIQNYVQVQKAIPTYLKAAYIPNYEFAKRNLEIKLANYARYRQFEKKTSLKK